MKDKLNRRRMVMALATLLLGLSACAGQAKTPAPSAEQQSAAQHRVQLAVQELLANQAADRVRTVSGVGFVLAPIAVFLADGEVSLIPSSPDLEAPLARLQREWLAKRRQPLPFDAFQRAFTLLTVRRAAVGRAGGETLIRFAQTDEKGRFTFERVPEGQWLLVADMSSPVSILLWAVPVLVGREDPSLLFLGEGNLLLEARTPQKAVPSR
jgi:hypothetical protein